MRHFIFVGERPSKLAERKSWAWTDGHLAAKQLFDGLEQLGIDPQAQRYVNLFTSSRARWPSKETIRDLRMLVAGAWKPEGKTWIVVAMGRTAQAILERQDIPHLKLCHPAARGLIRRKHIWYEHCATVLIHSRKIRGDWRQF